MKNDGQIDRETYDKICTRWQGDMMPSMLSGLLACGKIEDKEIRKNAIATLENIITTSIAFLEELHPDAGCETEMESERLQENCNKSARMQFVLHELEMEMEEVEGWEVCAASCRIATFAIKIMDQRMRAALDQEVK